MNAVALLSEARRRSGMTIRQLARRARTSHSAIAAYESGSKRPNLRTLDRLLHACGFELDAGLRLAGPFENHRLRGAELLEVLELADQLPSSPTDGIAAHFAGR